MLSQKPLIDLSGLMEQIEFQNKRIEQLESTIRQMQNAERAVIKADICKMSEAEKILPCKHGKIRLMIKRGEIPSARKMYDGDYIFDRAELLQIAEKMKNAS